MSITDTSPDFATRPSSSQEWIERARQVAAVLATDAVQRDRAGRTPHAEVQLLKDAGLVTLLGPEEHGGAGETWSTAYRVTREVARGDGSIGQLLGYHYLWAWAARLVGTPEQIEEVERLYTTGNLFFGGAVNPRDDDLVITDEGEELVFRGRKSFSTGSKVSDLTVLEGVLARGDRRVGAVIEEAYRSGAIYDSWSEYFNNDVWMKAFETCGVDMDFYTTRQRSLDEVFPCDFIDAGVTKEFLIREWNCAVNEQVTPNCRQRCSGCGAKSFGSGVCYETVKG